MTASTHAEDLAARLAHDLDGVFPDLVDHYGSMVLTLASRLTEPSTGEDITQEVFLRAYRAMRRYDTRQRAALDLRPWLATITRNLVRNEYRRRERKPIATSSSEPVADPGEGRIEQMIERVDASDQVAVLLAALSDVQREAVVLRHIVGLPIREVALSMACPEGTAKSHVSRGMARLRVAFDDLSEQHRSSDGGSL